MAENVLQGPAVLIECTGHCGEWCDNYSAADDHDWVICGEDLTMECWNVADSCCNPKFNDN